MLHKLLDQIANCRSKFENWMALEIGLIFVLGVGETIQKRGTSDQGGRGATYTVLNKQSTTTYPTGGVLKFYTFAITCNKIWDSVTHV